MATARSAPLLLALDELEEPARLSIRRLVLVQEGDMARLFERMVDAFLGHTFRLNEGVFRIGHMGHLNPPMILGTLAMSYAWDQNPQGQWDAWSIWNLRAKFIA